MTIANNSHLYRDANLQSWVDPRREYYRLAGEALRAGLLSPAEIRLLARQGTRKSGYWARHLRDLRAVVEERQRMTSKPRLAEHGD